jgi:hypothetical protein
MNAVMRIGDSDMFGEVSPGVSGIREVTGRQGKACRELRSFAIELMRDRSISTRVIETVTMWIEQDMKLGAGSTEMVEDTVPLEALYKAPDRRELILTLSGLDALRGARDEAGEYLFDVPTQHIPDDVVITPLEEWDTYPAGKKSGRRQRMRVTQGRGSVDLWCPLDFSIPGDALRPDDGFTVTETDIARARIECGRNYRIEIRAWAMGIIYQWRTAKYTVPEMVARGALYLVMMAVWDSIEYVTARAETTSSAQVGDYIRSVCRMHDTNKRLSAPKLLMRWRRRPVITKRRPSHVGAKYPDKVVKDAEGKAERKIIGDQEKLAYIRSEGGYLWQTEDGRPMATTVNGFARISLCFQAFATQYQMFDLPHPQDQGGGMAPVAQFIYSCVNYMGGRPSLRGKKCNGFADMLKVLLISSPRYAEVLPPQETPTALRSGQVTKTLACLYWDAHILAASLGVSVPDRVNDFEISPVSFTVDASDSSDEARLKWAAELRAAEALVEGVNPKSFRMALYDAVLEEVPAEMRPGIAAMYNAYYRYPATVNDNTYYRVRALLLAPASMDGYVQSSPSLAPSDIRTRIQIERKEGIIDPATPEAMAESDFAILSGMVRDACLVNPLPSAEEYVRTLRDIAAERSEGGENMVQLKAPASAILPPSASLRTSDTSGKTRVLGIKQRTKRSAIPIAAPYIVAKADLQSSPSHPVVVTFRDAVGRPRRIVAMVWMASLFAQTWLYKSLTYYMRKHNESVFGGQTDFPVKFANELGVGPQPQRMMARTTASSILALNLSTSRILLSTDGSRFDAHNGKGDRTAFMAGVSAAEQAMGPQPTKEAYVKLFGCSLPERTVQMLNAQSTTYFRVPVTGAPDQIMVLDLWPSGNRITAAGNSVKSVAMLRRVVEILRSQGFDLTVMGGEVWGDDAYLALVPPKTPRGLISLLNAMEEAFKKCGQYVAAFSGMAYMSFIHVDFENGFKMQPFMPMDSERQGNTFGASEAASVLTKIADSARRGGNREATSVLCAAASMCLTTMGAFSKRFRSPMKSLLGPNGMGVSLLGIPGPNSRMFLAMHAKTLGLSGKVFKLPNAITDGGIGKKLVDYTIDETCRGKVLDKDVQLVPRAHIEASSALLLDPRYRSELASPKGWEGIRYDNQLFYDFQQAADTAITTSADFRRTCIELTMIRSNLIQIGHISTLKTQRAKETAVREIENRYPLTSRLQLHIIYEGRKLLWNGQHQDRMAAVVIDGAGQSVAQFSGMINSAQCNVLMDIIGESLSPESALVTLQHLMRPLQPPGSVSSTSVIACMDSTPATDWDVGLQTAGFADSSARSKAIATYNLLRLKAGIVELAEYGATSSVVMGGSEVGLTRLMAAATSKPMPPDLDRMITRPVLTTFATMVESEIEAALCAPQLARASTLAVDVPAAYADYFVLCDLPSFNVERRM